MVIRRLCCSSLWGRRSLHRPFLCAFAPDRPWPSSAPLREPPRVRASSTGRPGPRASDDCHVAARSRGDPSAAGELPAEPRESASTSAARRLRVGVLARLQELSEMVEEKLSEADAVEWCHPIAGQPEALLLAAHSAHDVVVLLRLLPEAHAPLVILDLVADIGTRIAALHGAVGYLTMECVASRQVLCLRNVAQGLADAPDPHAASFHEQVRRKPLTPVQRRILELSAESKTRDEIAEALDVPIDTYEHWVTALRRRLDMTRNRRLPAEATLLGFDVR